MKKTTKSILIALVLLVVLGAAAAVLLLTEPHTDPDESESSAVSETETVEMLVDRTIDAVENVVLENHESGETWTMIPTKSDAEAEANNTFTFEGWEDEPVLYSNVLNVAQKFYSVTPSKEIGEVDDLAEYGLQGDGVFKAVVNYTDGTSDTIIVGTEAGETYGRYALFGDTVYIIPVSAYLEQKQVDFVETAVLAIPDNTEEDEATGIVVAADIQNITLSGTNYPETIKIQHSDDPILLYAITEPIYAGASTTRIESFIAQLQNITAAAVLTVDASEEDLAEYGLDEPSAIADYELNNEKHQIRLGNLEDGLYSMMIDDNTTIYSIDEASVDSWANVSLFDVRDGFIRLPNIKNVKKLTVTAEDGTDVYDAARVVNEEKSTESTLFYDMEISKNGKAIDFDTAYQPFYQMLLSVYLLNEDIREPEGEAVLKIRYDYYDGVDSDVIEFYADPENERRYVVTLNGNATGVVRGTDIENILEAKVIIADYQPLEEE